MTSIFAISLLALSFYYKELLGSSSYYESYGVMLSQDSRGNVIMSNKYGREFSKESKFFRRTVGKQLQRSSIQAIGNYLMIEDRPFQPPEEKTVVRQRTTTTPTTTPKTTTTHDAMNDFLHPKIVNKDFEDEFKEFDQSVADNDVEDDAFEESLAAPPWVKKNKDDASKLMQELNNLAQENQRRINRDKTMKKDKNEELFKKEFEAVKNKKQPPLDVGKKLFLKKKVDKWDDWDDLDRQRDDRITLTNIEENEDHHGHRRKTGKTSKRRHRNKRQ